jgi:hypothetical protein
MRYFLRYSTGPYDGWEFEEFSDIAQIESLLSRYAANRRLQFEVVRGEKIELEPVDVVKAYRVKR